MDKIQKMETVSQFNADRGQDTFHPLVTVLDQSKSKPIRTIQFISDLYIIFLKDVKCGTLSYGRNKYDYQDDTLIFIAPGQVLGLPDPNDYIQPQGWVLAFHPDLIRGTSLGRTIHDHNFFNYEMNEALHVSPRERQIVIDIFQKIIFELSGSIDKHTQGLVVNNIEQFLNYCTRFYDRQFITRKEVVNDSLSKFEKLLSDYYRSDKPDRLGLPSVAWCAEQLYLSSNYFGDLVKKHAGISAQEYIHRRIIDLAKDKVYDLSKTISEVSYELGFKNPTHFTRLFKQHVGQSPSEYRIQNGLD